MPEPSTEYLASLIDLKNEEPSIEYKGWLDLSEPAAKAKIAKQICGLANFGGGYIIFGVRNDGSYDEPHPGNLADYNQDIVNGIAGKYLTPLVHCTVKMITASNGKTYPVAIIPSHGAQPICAKLDGPEENKKRVGVQRGVHYIRVAGPKTVAIDNPELWREVLHRCVLKERGHLISAIEGLIVKPHATEVPGLSIDSQIDGLSERWTSLLPAKTWTVDLSRNRSIFAFQLLNSQHREVQTVELNALLEGVMRASMEAESFKGSDSTFMDAHNRSHRSVILIGDDEAYELRHIQENGEFILPPSMAQISVRGCGGEVRAYWEDTDWVKNVVERRSSRKWVSGESLTPRFQVDRALNFIAFVRSLSRTFSDARYASLAIDFRGLEGRVVDDPTPGVYFSIQRRAAVDKRRTPATVQLDALTDNRIVEIAADLVAPIFRLFEGWPISKAYVQERLEKRD